jgi:hypothetical protein
MERILIDEDKLPVEEDYQSIKDITLGSDFMNQLNTPTAKLDLEYNFYVFVSKKNSPLIPGEDDGTVNVKSAYPLDLIEKNKFENVKIKGVTFFEGDVNHFSIDSPDILKTILESLKSEKENFSISKILIPKCSPLEEKTRKFVSDLKKGIEFN